MHELGGLPGTQTIKVLMRERNLLGRGLGAIDVVQETSVAGSIFRVPTEVLAGDSDARPLTVEIVECLNMPN